MGSIIGILIMVVVALVVVGKLTQSIQKRGFIYLTP